MTVNEKGKFVDLLSQLQYELLKAADEDGKKIDETLDEAIKILINYLD